MKFIPKDSFPPQYLINWVTKRKALLEKKNGEQQWILFKKSSIRKKLQDKIIKEQGHICAYCNRRIHRSNPEDNEQMRIDHLEAKGNPLYTHKTLDYYNLVGSCFGEEKTLPRREVHCDPQKSDQELHKHLFPTKQLCESQLAVFITGDGKGVLVKEKSPELKTSVDDVLNLNHPTLQVLRKNALEEFLPFDSEFKLTSEEIQLLIEHYRLKNEHGQYEPYSGVILIFLIQELSFLANGI